MNKNQKWLGLFAVLAVLSSMSVSIARAEDQNADQNAIQAVDQQISMTQDNASDSTDVNADALALFLGCTRDHFSCQQLARSQGFGWYRVFREFRCGRWNYACYGE